MPAPFNYIAALAAVGVLVATLYHYNNLIKINPRLVQSEKYQTEMAKMDIIASKGGGVVFDVNSIEYGEEPSLLPGQELGQEDLE